MGKPARSVGGGSRGPGDGLPEVYVLVPNHVAQTSSPQPSLFWYIDAAPSPSMKVRFTLLDEDGVEPVVAAVIETPRRAGIYRIRLSKFGVELQPGIEYEWSVSVVVDPNDHAKDLVATGWIDRVERSEQLEARLASDGENLAVHVFADEGLWYDAMTAVGDQIEGSPGSAEFTTAREALLEQVGLNKLTAAL